jgi:hypothetical protein
MTFSWLVFAFLSVQLAKELGLPPKVAQAIQAALLLLMLLALLGVFGGGRLA